VVTVPGFCAGLLGRLSHEFVPFQSSGEGGQFGFFPQDLPDAAQANFAARTGSLGEGDEVLDGIADRDPILGGEQHPRRTQVVGLSRSLDVGSRANNLEWEAQAEALISALFCHRNLTL
jgi:hypothetical protein